MDVFASRENYELKRYWSLRADPYAEIIDVFRQKWNVLNPSMKTDTNDLSTVKSTEDT